MDKLRLALLRNILVLGVLLFAPRVTWAAAPTVTFLVPSGVQRVGDTMVVQVVVDSGGQNINAINAVVKYSPTYLEPLSVVPEKSFWPLWPEDPTWDTKTGTLTMIGGRPNGVVAIGAPFATITFKVKLAGLSQVVLDEAASGMYLNDNHGTRIVATSKGVDVALADQLVLSLPLDATTSPTPGTWSRTDRVHIGWVVTPKTEYRYSWSTDSQVVPDGGPAKELGSLDYTHLADGIYYWSIQTRDNGGLWSRISQYRFQLDHVAPLPFTITKLDPQLVGGHDVISWETSDAISGVASSHLLVGKRDVGQVHSPFQLDPSWQGSLLTIVVRDQAGNEQRATWQYAGMNPLVTYLGFAALAVIVIVLLRLRRRKR